MAEKITAREPLFGDGLFYALMAFILVGVLGTGMGYAYGLIHGEGWNGLFMVAGIVTAIGGTILAAANSAPPLRHPSEIPPAPTAAASGVRYAPPKAHETAHDLGVSVGAAVASVKERLHSAVETVSEKTGMGSGDGSADASKPPTLSAPRSEAGADDLKRIKGIGPKLEEMLHGLGYYHFDQIAAWTPAEVAWVDSNLEGFNGRATRDDWVGQARQLASGGETEFSKRVDDGEVY
jgi:NADH-quinone oxidoreductase subunit E